MKTKRIKLSDLKDLPDEDLRIKAAEAIGWTNVRRINRSDYSGLTGTDTDNIDRIVPSACRDEKAIADYERESGLPDKSNLDLRVRWINHLRDVVALRCDKNKSGVALVSDVDLCLASPRERTIALIMTLQ